MKRLLGISMFFLITSANAQKVECEIPTEVYKKGRAFIEMCLKDKRNVPFWAVSTGSRGHTCSLTGVSKLKNESYIFNKGKCDVAFTLTKNKLDASFGDGCWYRLCGMNANWVNGIFEK